MDAQVAALFVDIENGPYPGIASVDCWGVDRDALNYTGNLPVVAHPPCSRWSPLARVNNARWGTPIGEDGGVFAFALATVARCGGVLEHPAQSIAWREFSLPKPRFGHWTSDGQYWSTEVWQSDYGHMARKKTWLLYCSTSYPPFPLRWVGDSSRITHQVGGGVHTGNNKRKRLPSKDAHLTPVEFAVELVKLAHFSMGGRLPVDSSEDAD